MSCASVTVECTQCPVRPATNSADIPRSTCYVTSAMDVILAHYNCTLSRSLGDGHCLLYSVLSSCLCQLPDNIHTTSLECIKSYIFIELTDNIQYYLPFFQTADNQCIFKGLNDYSGTSPYGHLTSKKTSPLQSPWLSPKLYSTVQITPGNKVTSTLRSLLPSPVGDLNSEVPLYLIHKIYNQEFVDLVPALIANALNTRLVIFNEDRVKSSPPKVIRQSTLCYIDAVSTTMVFYVLRLRRRPHHRLRRQQHHRLRRRQHHRMRR